MIARAYCASRVAGTSIRAQPRTENNVENLDIATLVFPVGSEERVPAEESGAAMASSRATAEDESTQLFGQSASADATSIGERFSRPLRLSR